MIKKWFGIGFLSGICLTVPAAPQECSRPFLSMPSNSQVSINFYSAENCGAFVEYRRKDDAKYKSKTDQLGGIVLFSKFHNILLSGLEPGEYEYRVLPIDTASGLPDRKAIIGSGNFTISGPSRQTTRLWVTSDIQHRKIRDGVFPQLIAQNPLDGSDFIVCVGGSNDSVNHLDKDFLSGGVIATLQSNGGADIPMILVRGNHEYRGRAPHDFVRFFGHPETRKSYYALHYGRDLFIILDSFEDKADHSPGHGYTNRNVIPQYWMEQRKWLENLVQSPEFKNARYRIVFSHIPPYGGAEKYGAENMQTLIDGLLDGNEGDNLIHLWLSGHEHYYVRGLPHSKSLAFYRPLQRYVDSWRQSGEAFPFPVLLQDGPGYGGAEVSMSSITLSPEGIELKTSLSNGKVIDHFKIMTDGAIRIINDKELVYYEK